LRYISFENRERWFVAKLVWVAATILALLFFVQWTQIRIRTGGGFEWKLLANAFSLTYTWGATVPLILVLGYYYPFERKRVVRSVAVQFFLSIAVNFIIILCNFSVDWLIRMGGPPGWMGASSRLKEELSNYIINRTTTNLIFYWAILGVSQAITYFRKYQDRELRLTQAQLQVLKAQLNPHFLFNTLHSISTLIHEDVEIADRMVVHLGDFLRTTLRDVNVQEVSLKRELEVLGSYLQIELIRFRDRLHVEMLIDPEVMNAAVPNLILQPLVENAIKHGIAPHSLDGRIEIKAARENGMLQLQVCDDGPGASVEQYQTTEGVGLANTRARLKQLYGAAHHFEIKNGTGTGFVVEFKIPYREYDSQDRI
jgi:sensor histidine kinase YesM